MSNRNLPTSFALHRMSTERYATIKTWPPGGFNLSFAYSL